MKVGIAGASGIGRHHAKWYSRLGCEVAAIFATSRESGEAAAARMRDEFPFTGRVWTEWDEFVKDSGIEACSVCSPADRHAGNIVSLAAAGIHILCEKPLLWSSDADAHSLRQESQRVADAVRSAGVIFALNAQYPAAMPGWRELHDRITPRPPSMRLLLFRMESRGANRGLPGPEDSWIDLGPHPLAIVDHISPGAVDPATITHLDGPASTSVQFKWVGERGTTDVRILCRRVADGPVRRQVGNENLLVDYQAVERDGEFSTLLRSGPHRWTGPDLMQVSIESFVEAVREASPDRVLVSLDSALRQQEALLTVWEKCWGTQ